MSNIFKYTYYILQNSRYLSMKGTLAVCALSLITIIKLFFFPSPYQTNLQKQVEPLTNLDEMLKYNGKGFGVDLQNILTEAIHDSSIFFKDKYYYQTDFIHDKLKKAKPGDWDVVIISNLNISKITEVSTTFFYYSFNDTWALWYQSSPYANLTLHIAIYNNNTEKAPINLSTNQSAKGGSLTSDDMQVFKSIVSTLPTVQDMAKYLQKFFNNKWSILSIPETWSGRKPEAYSTLNVDDLYVSFSKNVTIGNVLYSQLFFV